MGRVLAIDYGKKRTGVAVTDPLQSIANGLTTVFTSSVMDFIVSYVRQEHVERIVVGLPKQANGEDSENMGRINSFVRRLHERLPEIPVEFFDERYTSPKIFSRSGYYCFICGRKKIIYKIIWYYQFILLVSPC